MALASCVDNYPMVRNVSCVFYNDKIYFKTDKNLERHSNYLKILKLRCVLMVFKLKERQSTKA